MILREDKLHFPAQIFSFFETNFAIIIIIKIILITMMIHCRILKPYYIISIRHVIMPFDGQELNKKVPFSLQ